MTPAIAGRLDLDGVDGRSAPRDFGDMRLRAIEFTIREQLHS
jgi:hypothetical protein